MKHSVYTLNAYLGRRPVSPLLVEPDAANWQAAVDAEAMKMMLFADGSPLGLILDVLEQHPDLKTRIVELLTARMQTGEARDEESA